MTRATADEVLRGRTVVTSSGERGRVVPTADRLSRLTHEQLVQLVMAKDYLVLVEWEPSGKLELVTDRYLLADENEVLPLVLV